jgi:hypothetical protein
MLAWLVDATDFRPSRSGDGTVPMASHSLRECRRVMVRRRRLFAHLRYPVMPRLARVLAWLVDMTDFRPSRNGVARIEPVDAATWMRVRVRARV